jgi:hypothetical protein
MLVEETAMNRFDTDELPRVDDFDTLAFFGLAGFFRGHCVFGHGNLSDRWGRKY